VRSAECTDGDVGSMTRNLAVTILVLVGVPFLAPVQRASSRRAGRAGGRGDRGPEERPAPGQGHRERGSVQHGTIKSQVNARSPKCSSRRAGRAAGEIVIPDRSAALRVRPPAGEAPLRATWAQAKNAMEESKRYAALAGKGFVPSRNMTVQGPTPMRSTPS